MGERGVGDPVDAIGNNVNIENEVVEMMETNLLQQAMVEAFNFKAGLLRSAIPRTRLPRAPKRPASRSS